MFPCLQDPVVIEQVETTITVIFEMGSDPWDSLSPAEQEVRCCGMLAQQL
jgi:hypothetical protein